MKDERIYRSLSRVTLPAEQKDALLCRILADADAQRARTREEHPVKTKRNTISRSLKWLIPVAATAAVLAVLFSIPSVTHAVVQWFGELFRIEEYLSDPPDARDPVPAVEEAIQTPAADAQRYDVRLLHETDEHAGFNEARTQYGFPAFDPAKWEWLKDARPELLEVLYDDGMLYVTAFLHIDPLPFFYTGDQHVDWIADGATLRLDGTDVDIPLQNASTGIYPKPEYYREDGTLNEAALLADGGVYLVSSYRTPEDLETGAYTLTQTSRILDVDVDPMANFATVARVDQTAPVVIDTTAAPALTGSGTVALSGAHTLTVESHDGAWSVCNREVDLAGVSVAAEAVPHTTGLRVTLRYAFPGGWTDEMRQALIGGLPRLGIQYALLVDGELVEEELYQENDSDYRTGVVVLELPLLPDAQAAAGSVALRASLAFATSLTVNDEDAGKMTSPYTFDTTVAFSYDMEYAAVSLFTLELAVSRE